MTARAGKSSAAPIDLTTDEAAVRGVRLAMSAKASDVKNQLAQSIAIMQRHEADRKASEKRMSGEASAALRQTVRDLHAAERGADDDRSGAPKLMEAYARGRVGREAHRPIGAELARWLRVRYDVAYTLRLPNVNSNYRSMLKTMNMYVDSKIAALAADKIKPAAPFYREIHVEADLDSETRGALGGLEDCTDDLSTEVMIYRRPPARSIRDTPATLVKHMKRATIDPKRYLWMCKVCTAFRKALRRDADKDVRARLADEIRSINDRFFYRQHCDGSLRSKEQAFVESCVRHLNLRVERRDGWDGETRPRLLANHGPDEYEILHDHLIPKLVKRYAYDPVVGGGSGTPTLWGNLSQRFLGVTKVAVDAARKALPRYQLMRNPLGAGGAWGGHRRNQKKVPEKNHTWQMDLTEFGLTDAGVERYIKGNPPTNRYIGWNAIIDVCSRYVWTSPVRVKKTEDGETRDVGSRSRAFATHLRSLFFEHERPPRYLIVDNAFENRSEAVLAVCNEADVTVMPIDPYTPQQNAMVERCHRAIKDALRPIILHEHEALVEKTRREVVGDADSGEAARIWSAWREKNPLRPRLEADYVFQDLLKRATMHVNCKPRAGLRNMSAFEFHKSAKPPTDRFLGAGFRRDASLAEVRAGDPVEVLVARADGSTGTLTCRGVKEADGVRITHVVEAGGRLVVPEEVRGGTVRHGGREYRIQHAWRRSVAEGLDEGTKRELEALRRGPERHAAYALVMEDLAGEGGGAAGVREALGAKLRDTAPDQLQRRMEATVAGKSRDPALPQNVRRTLREVNEAFQADAAEEAPNVEEATRQAAVDGVKAAMNDAQRFRKMMDNFNAKMRGANQNMDVKGSFTAPVRRGAIVRRHRSVYDKTFKKQVKGNITNKKDFFSQFSDEIYAVKRIVETTWNPAKFGKQVDRMKYEQDRDTGRNATRFGYFLVPHGQPDADELGPYARGEILLVPRSTLKMMAVQAPLPRAEKAGARDEAEEEEEAGEALEEEEVAPFRGVLPAAAMPETRAELDALRGYVANFSAYKRKTIDPAQDLVRALTPAVGEEAAEALRAFYAEPEPHTAERQWAKWKEYLADVVVRITSGRRSMYGVIDDLYIEGNTLAVRIGDEKGQYTRDISVDADTDALANATQQILRHMWRHEEGPAPEAVPQAKTIIVYAYEETLGQSTRAVRFYPGILHAIHLRHASAIVEYESASDGMQKGTIPFDLKGIPVQVVLEGRTEEEDTESFTVLRNSVAAVPPALTATLLAATDAREGLSTSQVTDKALLEFLRKVLPSSIDGGGPRAPRVALAPGPALAHRVAAQRRSLAALRHFYK